MALPAGKVAYVAARVAAENAFAASFGQPPLSDVDAQGSPTGNLTKVQAKFGAEYDALVIAFTTNAVILPGTMNMAGKTAAVAGAVATINAPGIVAGAGVLT